MIRRRSRELAERVRESLWFIPGLIAIAAAVLAILTPPLERFIGDTFLKDFPLLFSGRPVGARAVLTTIAGSMISIAGVVFSMTIVSLQLASSQFGPRLLRTFLRDRGNQTVLGTFVGIFLYCVLVLPSVDSSDGSEFVPRVAVSFAVLLAVLGLAMLVYYIDHVAQSIHANAVIQAVSDELEGVIDELFPADVGQPAEIDDANDVVAAAGGGSTREHAVKPAGSGYLRYVNANRLLSMATQAGGIIRIDVSPGEFVTPRTRLATVLNVLELGDADERRMRDCFALGPHRTTLQDLVFSFDQLAEMAGRALSPGINDPNTAIHCIDRMGSGLVRLVARPLPSSIRRDEQGAPRLIAPPVGLAQVLQGPFDLVARCATSQLAVSIRLMEVLRAAHDVAHRSEDQRELRSACRWIGADTQRLHHQDTDLKRLDAAAVWARNDLPN